jgi:hypothetical protein
MATGKWEVDLLRGRSGTRDKQPKQTPGKQNANLPENKKGQGPGPGALFITKVHIDEGVGKLHACGLADSMVKRPFEESGGPLREQFAANLNIKNFKF